MCYAQDDVFMIASSKMQKALGVEKTTLGAYSSFWRTGYCRSSISLSDLLRTFRATELQQVLRV